jgi:hypothetical protein
MGEGVGEGDSQGFPLTSILSPGGERKYFRKACLRAGRCEWGDLKVIFSNGED